MTLKHFLSALVLWLLLVIQVIEPPYSSEAASAHAEAAADEVVVARWVPSFNFTLGGRPAVDDRTGRREAAAAGAGAGAGGGGAAAAEAGVEEDSPTGYYNSNELSRWHQEQHTKVLPLLREATGNIRNVATLMVSIIYERGDRVFIRNRDYNNRFFLSGFAIEDKIKDHTPLSESTYLPILSRDEINERSGRTVFCISDLVVGENSQEKYRAYSEQVNGLYERDYWSGKFPKSPFSRKGKNFRARFQARECHSERGIILFLLNDLSEICRPLVLDESIRIHHVVINIATFNDPCIQCQNDMRLFTATSELPISVVCSGGRPYREERAKRPDGYAVDFGNRIDLHEVAAPVLLLGL